MGSLVVLFSGAWSQSPPLSGEFLHVAWETGHSSSGGGPTYGGTSIAVVTVGDRWVTVDNGVPRLLACGVSDVPTLEGVEVRRLHNVSGLEGDSIPVEGSLAKQTLSQSETQWKVQESLTTCLEPHMQYQPAFLLLYIPN